MAEQNELKIVRTFNAPKELVWKAFSQPEHLKKWWGPKEYTAPDCNMDFRIGGKYHVSMMDAAGKKIWSTGVYKEIIPNKKLVATDSFADENGNVVSGDQYGMPGMPLEFIITIELEEENGKTKMTLLHAGFPAGEMQKGANEGWNSSFDKMDRLLAELQK
jgi:uncharacterized protein YndB with AHSA1/START domain